MKIITQISLFDDTQNENLGDLEQLQKVLDNLSDEQLKAICGHGRNEWSVESMWNALVASFVFDHASIASLLRNSTATARMEKGIKTGLAKHCA